MRVTGYPIVFGSTSVDLGGFVEVIRPEAVDRTLRGSDDVVALFNHDSGAPLGRRSAGTLALQKDRHGLHVDLDVDEQVSYAGDLVRIIRRSDAPGGSFGFVTLADIWSTVNGAPFREVLDMHIRELSVGVAFPAYPGTRLSLAGSQRSDPAATDRRLARLDAASRSIRLLEQQLTRAHRAR